jgi:DNA replication protein DnaC
MKKRILSFKEIMDQANNADPEIRERQRINYNRHLKEEEEKLRKENLPIHMCAQYGLGVSPSDYADYDNNCLESIEINEHNEKILRFLMSWSPDKGGILLTGPQGRGKTTILRAFSLNMVRRQRKVCFMTMQRILDTLKGDGKDYFAIIGKYAQFDVILIDDIGKEITSDWTDKTLWEFFNMFERKNISIFGSSNLSKEDFSEKYDSATTSRMADKMLPVPLNGADYRALKRRQRQQLFFGS